MKSAAVANAQPQQRPVREYQFIPEQPTGRPEEPHFYDRTTQLNLYPNAERPYDVVAASRVRSLTQPGPLFAANETYAPGDVYFQGRVPNVGPSMFPPPEAGASGLIAPNDLNFEGGQRLDGFNSFGIEGHHPHALLQALASTKAFEPENLNLFQEQERARNEKKRKVCVVAVGCPLRQCDSTTLLCLYLRPLFTAPCQSRPLLSHCSYEP